MKYPKKIIDKAKQITVLLLDIDGVFTDGRLVYGEHGETLKQFSVLDGQGLKFLQDIGIEITIISGRSGMSTQKRLSDLGMKNVFLGISDKLVVAQKFLDENNYAWTEVCCMGDDWADLQILSHSQLSCAPANAHLEVKARVDWVANQRGGEGALRELCDLILTAKGKYKDLLSVALGLNKAT